MDGRKLPDDWLEHMRGGVKQPCFDYIVEVGDTLEGIAERFGCSVGSLRALKALSKEQALHAGQVLRVLKP